MKSIISVLRKNLERHSWFHSAVGILILPNKFLNICGLIASLSALVWATMTIFGVHLFGISDHEFLRKVFGIAFVIFLFRCVARDFYEVVWEEQTAPVLQGLVGTHYDYKKLFAGEGGSAYLVSQNLGALAGKFKDDFRSEIIRRISDESRPIETLTIICASPDALKGILASDDDHLEKNAIPLLQDLENYVSDKPYKKRLRILFHRGAATLSCNMVESQDSHRSIAVVNPKFAHASTGGRSYFVVEKSRLPSIFDHYRGQIIDMVNSGKTLDEVVRQTNK